MLQDMIRRVRSLRFSPFHLFALLLLLVACQSRQTKSFVNVLDSNDSLNIAMGEYTIVNYHSEQLDIDIEYPSYLRHQYLEDDQMEVFMDDNDVSLSFMVQNYDNDDLYRTPSQTLMGMGAELLEAGEDYSIHTGQEGELEYYGKVIEDTTRVVTVILRYLPKHAEAVGPLRQYVHDYRVNN